ncbi:uncharacterized protein LOC132983642 [Labrus mixtus]|uniref:uncharacterized protein LOC132983642 n=1 Tax=Labrus mixtus TaxID=508554 RepID=UPI0029C09500|nr:uncharacterized protein LOC132983642 [Labrus mixtus]
MEILYDICGQLFPDDKTFSLTCSLQQLLLFAEANSDKNNPANGYFLAFTPRNEAGLSSTMRHTCNKKHADGDLQEKHISVRAITKDEPDNSEHHGMVGMLCLNSDANVPKLSCPTRVNDTPRDSDAEEEAAILHGKPCVVEEGPKCSFLKNKTDGLNAAAKPQCPLMVTLKPRKSHQQRKRATAVGFLLCSMLLHASGAEGSFARPKCFTCNDTDRCQHLTTIYTPENHLLFDSNDCKTFPACSDRHKTACNHTCAVCDNKHRILIYCPDDVEDLEVEDGKGQIQNITSGCEERQTTGRGHHGLIAGEERQTTGRGHYGLIAVIVIVVIVVIVLLVCYICKKNRAVAVISELGKST